MGKHPRNALTFTPPFGATPHTFFIALCAIAVTLTISLSACAPLSSKATHEPLAITSRTLKNIDELNTPSTPTNGGTHVSTALKNNILTVASINSAEHTPQWALDISLTNAPDSSISWPDYSDHDLTGRLSATTVGALVVSPHGNYVSLALQVTRKQEDEPQLTDQSSTVELASQQRGYVVVLDARTGKTVLTREVSGFILAQALTNDHLVVETARAYFPAGEGKGTITAFPLNGTSSPTTTPTDQWLVGAGDDSLLLSPQPRYPGMCSSPCGPFTLTRISTNGHKLATITHADRVYRGGWVERYKEPAPDGGDGEASAQAAREVVDVDTGAATDLNGDHAEETGLPTGPGLLVMRRPDPDKQSSPSVPVFWLSAADDGHPHTENLEQFTTK
ncbi:hypothetical protein [Actinomyces sp. oral taxon 171]|uniref:hypothetical protein n=1 Tax=Actinomyces sp. oral taxon 171 TaxID=706438 RepID=UPI0002D7D132|nr:hypothetical protein [Actinomyces sp. oral taxon 171]